MSEKNHRLCKTNSEAIRWVKNRFATINFFQDGDFTECKVILGKREKTGSSLIQTVNEWIKHFSRELP